MIGKASSDGRGSLYPAVTMPAHPQLQAQALVLGAEVVDTGHQVHERLQGLWVANQRPAAPHQDRQARAEGGVQALDESGVELGSAVALCQQGLGSFQTALCHVPGNVDHPLSLAALDHLADVNVWPGDQPGASTFAIWQRAAKHRLHGLDIGDKAIHADQQRASQSTSADDLHQAQDQVLVSLFGDHTAQP